MDPKTDDLLIFDDNDLLGINDIPCSNIISKNKTYYELESELQEVTNKLKVLQQQMENILQMSKQTEIIYIYSLNNKMEIISTNCNNITFEFQPPDHVNGIQNSDSGIIIIIDNVKLRNYDCNNVVKLLKTFKNINEININVIFPISIPNANTSPPTSYFISHFNIIKKIVELNNNIKIKIEIKTLTFPFNWLEDIFEDIINDNINIIYISYQNREDLQNTRFIKQVMKKLDKTIVDKFILDVVELKTH